MYFFATVIAVCVYLVGRDLRRSRGLQFRTFPFMLIESAILAAILGVVLSAATTQLIGALAALSTQSAAAGSIETMAPATKLMLALGAGLYEELLFRVLIVGSLAAGLRWLLPGNRAADVLAVAVGALIFSAFHYVGQFGDRWQLASFTYRTLAGVAFSAMYLTRGFGITAWTHALYDVYVMLL